MVPYNSSRAMVKHDRRQRPSTAIARLVRGVGGAVTDMIPFVSEAKQLYQLGKAGYNAGKELYSQMVPARGAPAARPWVASVTRGSSKMNMPGQNYPSIATVGTAVSSRSGAGRPVGFVYRQHPKHGTALVMSGTQIFTQVNQTTGSTAAFATISRKALHPKALGYLVSLVSDMYASYRFTRVAFRYNPGCPSTTAGQLRISFSQDPTSVAYDSLDFEKSSLFPHQITCGAWEPAGMIIDPVPCAYEKMFQYDAATTQAAERTTKQGMIFGFWNAVAGSDISTGTLELDYEIELYDAGPSLTGLPTLADPLSEMRVAIQRGDSLGADKLCEHVHAVVDRLRAGTLSTSDMVVVREPPTASSAAAAAASAAPKRVTAH